MVLGIGVDNMFVIVSCVDQSPTDLQINERIRIGLVHAGPSITITSLTDCIAFFLASWTALAPLESLKSDKFFIGPNTLQVNPTGFIVATHIQKTTMAAWRWDKTSQPVLKSPTKEELTAVKMICNGPGQDMLICGTKKGKILIYQIATGFLLAEIQNAHYLAINQLDINNGDG